MCLFISPRFDCCCWKYFREKSVVIVVELIISLNLYFWWWFMLGSGKDRSQLTLAFTLYLPKAFSHRLKTFFDFAFTNPPLAPSHSLSPGATCCWDPTAPLRHKIFSVHSFSHLRMKHVAWMCMMWTGFLPVVRVGIWKERLFIRLLRRGWLIGGL